MQPRPAEIGVHHDDALSAARESRAEIGSDVRLAHVGTGFGDEDGRAANSRTGELHSSAQEVEGRGAAGVAGAAAGRDPAHALRERSDDWRVEPLLGLLALAQARVERLAGHGQQQPERNARDGAEDDVRARLGADRLGLNVRRVVEAHHDVERAGRARAPGLPRPDHLVDVRRVDARDPGDHVPREPRVGRVVAHRQDRRFGQDGDREPLLELLRRHVEAEVADHVARDVVVLEQRRHVARERKVAELRRARLQRLRADDHRHRGAVDRSLRLRDDVHRRDHEQGYKHDEPGLAPDRSQVLPQSRIGRLHCVCLGEAPFDHCRRKMCRCMGNSRK